MEKFGPVKYAVLCKSINHSADGGESVSSNKGTGFVQYKNQASADQLIELSRKVEETMDDERRNSRLNNVRAQQQLVSSLTLLKNEIELDGRRLIVKPSISKEQAGNLKQQATLDVKAKKIEDDKRNLGMAKEGLLNETNWLHHDPPPQPKQMEVRQRLWVSKDQALKKSTNLFISKTRL
jgi:RNA recognition motif-containing protein